jgi:hypothetical protein
MWVERVNNFDHIFYADNCHDISYNLRNQR